MPLAVHFHEHLIQMPAPLARLHARNPPFSDLRGKHWTEPMPPKPHVQHHCQADYLTARYKVAKWIRSGHVQKLQIRPARLKPVSDDNAPSRSSPRGRCRWNRFSWAQSRSAPPEIKPSSSSLAHPEKGCWFASLPKDQLGGTTHAQMYMCSWLMA